MVASIDLAPIVLDSLCNSCTMKSNLRPISLPCSMTDLKSSLCLFILVLSGCLLLHIIQLFLGCVDFHRFLQTDSYICESVPLLFFDKVFAPYHCSVQETGAFLEYFLVFVTLLFLNILLLVALLKLLAHK